MRGRGRDLKVTGLRRRSTIGLLFVEILLLLIDDLLVRFAELRELVDEDIKA
jgi:hypothetical protein